MSAMHRRTSRLTALLLVLSLGAAGEVAAGQDAGQPRPPSQQRPLPGFDVFGTVATTWPTAKESFEATGLERRPLEFGGGALFTNAWRNLFVQFNVTRWSDEGERVFIAADGQRFPLGIPLDVNATFLDIGAGWEFGAGPGAARPRILPYVGAGAGAVFYKEESPFAEPGDDVDERAASYHVAAGVQVRLLNWLGVGFDARYRYVPDLLGENGVSAALGDDSLGGFQASVGVRIGFRRTGPATPEAPTALPAEPPGVARPVNPPARRQNDAAMIESGPVFLYPDSTRKPMRILERGTGIRVLEERGDWLLIEFQDAQYGPRRGYVPRKYVQIPKQD